MLYHAHVLVNCTMGVEPTRLTTCYMCVYATNLRLRERMSDCMNENQWTQRSLRTTMDNTLLA